MPLEINNTINTSLQKRKREKQNAEPAKNSTAAAIRARLAKILNKVPHCSVAGYKWHEINNGIMWSLQARLQICLWNLRNSTPSFLAYAGMQSIHTVTSAKAWCTILVVLLDRPKSRHQWVTISSHWRMSPFVASTQEMISESTFLSSGSSVIVLEFSVPSTMYNIHTNMHTPVRQPHFLGLLSKWETVFNSCTSWWNENLSQIRILTQTLLTF